MFLKLDTEREFREGEAEPGGWQGSCLERGGTLCQGVGGSETCKPGDGGSDFRQTRWVPAAGLPPTVSSDLPKHLS